MEARTVIHSISEYRPYRDGKNGYAKALFQGDRFPQMVTMTEDQYNVLFDRLKYQAVTVNIEFWAKIFTAKDGNFKPILAVRILSFAF